MNWVIDASVIVALFAPERNTAACAGFLRQALAEEGSALLAPDCLYYEVTAALRRRERQGGYNTLERDLKRLMEMPVLSTPCRDLAVPAAVISRQHMLSPYDAFYLALAQRENAPLITVDQRLVNGAQGKGFDARGVTA